MKLWALRLVLFVVALVPLLFWGLVFAPGLVYVMPLFAFLAAWLIVRRIEFWLVEQGFLRSREPRPTPISCGLGVSIESESHRRAEDQQA